MSFTELPTKTKYYCLSERLQGAWLGSILAEAAVTQVYSSDRTKIINYQVSSWLKLRSDLVTAIVNRQQLPIELFNSDWLLLILLPIIFFGHENFNLLQFGSIKNYLPSRNRSQVFNDILLWNYTISLALKAKLDGDNPIEQILAGVGIDAASLSELHIVARASKQNKALNKIVETLLDRGNYRQTAIATSLYCFATIPEDFYLALNLVRSLSNVAFEFKQFTAILTATLSGAYNSLAGIPANWQRFGTQNQIYRQEQKTAVDLFNNWLGVFQPQKPKNSRQMTVVAAPKIIQSRPSLNIVSQTDY